RSRAGSGAGHRSLALAGAAGPGGAERGVLPSSRERQSLRRKAEQVQSGTAEENHPAWENLSFQRGIEGKILPARLHRELSDKRLRYRYGSPRGRGSGAGIAKRLIQKKQTTIPSHCLSILCAPDHSFLRSERPFLAPFAVKSFSIVSLVAEAF